MNTIKCDGQWTGCSGAGVTHIDGKGFAYCANCGPIRQASRPPCRRLKVYEQRELQAGRTISYEIKPKAYYQSKGDQHAV